MNQGTDRLLELATELLTARGENDFIAAVDRHLPGILSPGAWQIWSRDEGTWACKLHGRCKEGLETVTPQDVARLAAGEPVQRPAEDGPLVVPLDGHEEDGQRLLLIVGWPKPQLLQRLGPLLAAALDNIHSRIYLEQQTITDDVSGLYNARHFRSLVDYEMERARRYGQDLSLIFFDLDHFKQVNNTHGHLVGSQVLRQIGHFLRTRTRRVNISCRYGGDEYVLLLPSTSKAGALTLAEKLRKELAEYPFVFDGVEPIRITASFGVAAFPGDALNPEKLLQQADRAMYRVKAAGRDGVAAA